MITISIAKLALVLAGMLAGSAFYLLVIRRHSEQSLKDRQREVIADAHMLLFVWLVLTWLYL